MVLTASGLVAIEKIKAGDIVISTNPDTLETAGKTVLETYVRQVDKLVHLTVNGEEIVTTVDHPFYVQGKGFINAGNLLVDDTLVSVNGEDLSVDDCYIEECDFPTTVYNFQVEDYHTYFVSQSAVWVHNADYKSNRSKYMGNTPSKKSKTGREVIERMTEEGKIQKNKNGDMEFLAGDGNWYPLEKADMAHKTDAVSWWNSEGKNYGAKSPEVRKFMLDSNNYELELNSINRSQGPHNVTYDPPTKK